MRIASKIIAILLAISIIGALASPSSVRPGEADLTVVFIIIRLLLIGVFAYFGWRPKKNSKDGLHKDE